MQLAGQVIDNLPITPEADVKSFSKSPPDKEYQSHLEIKFDLSPNNYFCFIAFK